MAEIHTEAQRHGVKYPLFLGLSVPQCLGVIKNHHFHAPVSFFLTKPLFNLDIFCKTEENGKNQKLSEIVLRNGTLAIQTEK
jgi:hypothetical protein